MDNSNTYIHDGYMMAHLPDLVQVY